MDKGAECFMNIFQATSNFTVQALRFQIGTSLTKQRLTLPVPGGGKCRATQRLFFDNF